MAQIAADLANEYQFAVTARWRREDVLRFGAKRPPMAIGLRSDGSGSARVARTPGIAEAIATVAPAVEVELVGVVGPPTSTKVRGAGWAEILVMLAVLRDDPMITAPNGARATARVEHGDNGASLITVEVWAGEVLDHVVLRSYCIGATHQALGWVTSEGLSVDDDGAVLDLTIRAQGIIRAADTPTIEVIIHDDPRASVRGSDAVFVAVAAAVWNDQGCPPTWPTRQYLR